MSENRVFPTWMHHPAFQPAVVSEPVRVGSGEIRPDNPVRAQPIKFAPVMVHNEDEEAYYESKGYVSQGNDPVAFSRLSRPGLPTPPPKTVNGQPAEKNPVPDDDGQYPRWVGDKMVRDEYEEWAECQATGIPFEGRGGSKEAPVYPAGIDISARGSSRHEPVAPAAPPAIPDDEWEAFQAWKAGKTKQPNGRPPARHKTGKKRNLTPEQRAAIGQRLKAGRAAKQTGEQKENPDAR